MAEQEVLFRLKVESGSGAAGVDKLAASTRTAGKEAEAAEAKFKKMNQGAAAFDPRAEAQKILEKRTQQSQIKSELDRLAPPMVTAAPLPPGGGIPPALKAAIGIQAAGQAFQAAGQQLISTGDQILSAGDQFDKFANKLTGAIPLIGPFITGIVDIFEAASGLPALRAANKKFLAIQAGQIGLQTGTQGIQIGAAGQLAGLDRASGVAGIDAAAARQFQASLTPVAMAAFRPRVEFGKATEQTGELRFQQAQAQAEADAASQQAAAERARFGKFESGLNLPALRDAVKMNQGFADAAQDPLRRANDAAENKPGFIAGAAKGFLGPGLLGGVAGAVAVGGGTAFKESVKIDTDMENARTKALQAQQGLKGALTQQEQALKSIQEQRSALAASETNDAQKQLALAQAKVAVTRDQLALVTQQVDAGRQGAQFAGGAKPGDLEAIEAAIKQAKLRGIQDISDEQKALVRSFGPAGAAFIDKANEARGRDMPGLDRINAELGQAPLADLERQQAQLQDEVRQQLLSAQVAFKDTVGVIASEFGTKLAAAFKEGAEVVIAKFKADLNISTITQGQQLAAQNAGG